jgi:hypothetical protein
MKRRGLLVIGVAVAVVLVIEGVFAIQLSTASHQSHRAFPGQLLAVNLSGEWTGLTSSDASVIAPIRVNLSPSATGYFVAIRPGKATLMAQFHPSCLDAVPQCLPAQKFWSIEIDVRLFPWGP